MNKNKKRATTFYAALFVLGVVLYFIAHAEATRQRGYIAFGGECMLLLMPLWGYIAKAIAKDFAELRKDGRCDE